MAEFINTIDLLGDDAVVDGIIDKTITEFKDDKLTSVGNYAFNGCSELETINFPLATKIYNYAFQNCSNLRDISAPLVTSIGVKSFNNCASLEEADFPSVTSMGTSAGGGFVGCTNLKKINFPLLKKVNNDFGSSALVSAVLPSATSIGGFSNCKSLVLCDFPVAETIVGSAFFNSTALTALILRNTSAVCTNAATNALLGTPIKSGTGYIYVPRALVDSYKAATNWSIYADQFRALEDYTVDGTTTGELDETKI